MIPTDDRAYFEAALTQLRSLHGELADRHAGMCVLHLDAAIAALEGHLRRGGVPPEALRAEPILAAEPTPQTVGID